jgi:hypothetical protein
VQLWQNIEQEWAGRALAEEARHQVRDIQRRITYDARARLPPASSGVGQNLAAAAMLLRAIPEPSTTEGRRIQGELKNLLEYDTVQRAESSAFRRQGCPPEHRAATSRFMWEASVHTGRTRDATPAAPGRLGNEHHCRDRQARLDEKVRRGYHPRHEGRYDNEDRSPSPEPLGPQAFSRAIRQAPFPTRFRAPTTITKYSGETRPELWLADYQLACQLGGTDDDNIIIRNLPCSSPMPPEPGWSICPRHRSPTGTTWSKPSLETSRAHTCALGTPGISEAAASNQGNPCGSTSGDFRSSAPRYPTSPTRMSSDVPQHTPPAGVDPRFKSLQNHVVGALHLPIRHGVSYGDLVHTDVVVLTEVQELLPSELGAVVGDDGVRDPKAIDDVGEERHRLLGPDAG